MTEKRPIETLISAVDSKIPFSSDTFSTDEQTKADEELLDKLDKLQKQIENMINKSQDNNSIIFLNDKLEKIKEIKKDMEELGAIHTTILIIAMLVIFSVGAKLIDLAEIQPYIDYSDEFVSSLAVYITLLLAHNSRHNNAKKKYEEILIEINNLK